jgi:PAS domain S-box-containing protein
MATDAFALPSADGPLRDFMQALPTAVYTTDASGFVTFFNQAAADLAGRSPEVGRDRWCVIWRLYWADGRPMRHEDCPMAVALKENRAVTGVEVIAERPNGTRCRLIPHSAPIRDQSGALTGGINVLVDVTERKAADSSRKSLLSAFDKKLATILHLVNAILRETQQQSGGACAEEMVLNAIQRFETLSAAQSLFPSDAAVIGSWDLLSTASIVARSAISEGVDLLCESSAGDLMVEAAIPLTLIAKELIANAAKHGLKGRTTMLVRVGLRKELGDYILTVEDDGPGYTLPAKPRSFGLSLVTALVRLLNGTFEVDQGAGACCRVRFPDRRKLN